MGTGRDVERASRATAPLRSARVFPRVTVAIHQRLERLSKQRGWTLSKTAFLCIEKGLEVFEAEATDSE